MLCLGALGLGTPCCVWELRAERVNCEVLSALCQVYFIKSVIQE